MLVLLSIIKVKPHLADSCKNTQLVTLHLMILIY
jgi:hypothetical protein